MKFQFSTKILLVRHENKPIKFSEIFSKIKTVTARKKQIKLDYSIRKRDINYQ